MSEEHTNYFNKGPQEIQMHMSVFDYAVHNSEEDFDTSDDMIDCLVTVCFDPEEQPIEPYDKFVHMLLKRVHYLYSTSSNRPVCDWSGLITKNSAIFSRLAKGIWNDDLQYEDEGEYLYRWIATLAAFISGYTNDTTYRQFIKEFEVIPEVN